MAVELEGLLGYTAMPMNVTLPFDHWETWINQTCPETFGIVWCLSKCVPIECYATRNQKADDIVVLAKRGRGTYWRNDKIWTVLYACDRAGEKRAHPKR